MIKINLLGLPKAKKVKKANRAQTQLILGVTALVLSSLLSLYGWYWLSNRITSLNEEKGKKEKELAFLKDKVKEVEALEQLKKNLEDKVQIIDQLKKNQSGPVHFLDELSRSLPPRVWVLSFSEQNGDIDMDAKAMSNTEIVAFLENMTHSKHFSNVQLIETRSVTEANTNIFAFKIKFHFQYIS